MCGLADTLIFEMGGLGRPSCKSSLDDVLRAAHGEVASMPAVDILDGFNVGLGGRAFGGVRRRDSGLVILCVIIRVADADVLDLSPFFLDFERFLDLERARSGVGDRDWDWTCDWE